MSPTEIVAARAELLAAQNKLLAVAAIIPWVNAHDGEIGGTLQDILDGTIRPSELVEGTRSMNAREVQKWENFFIIPAAEGDPVNHNHSPPAFLFQTDGGEISPITGRPEGILWVWIRGEWRRTPIPPVLRIDLDDAIEATLL